MNRIVFCIFICVVGLASCSPVEEVETRDEQGRIERYERRKKDFAKEGRYVKLSADGRTAIEATYANDVLHGKRTFYYPNGQAETIEHFVNGDYHGLYQHFYENGTLQLEQTYVKGALQGISKSFYPGGSCSDEVTMANNEEDGPFTEYYENGRKKAEGYYTPGPDGPLEQGELKEYNEAGELIRTANCVDGRCTTIWKKE
jgi:antitoxin component YwqK of YwqJK toxin-antitoxin module